MSSSNSLQRAEKPVNRAARRALGALVHADHEKVLIAPFPRAGERVTVRLPLEQIPVHRGEELPFVHVLNGRGGGEDPDARIVGERRERNEGRRSSERAEGGG